MQLRAARLCLNCEEVHDAYECPVCNSETFTYISRWVPAPERRHQPRTVASSPEAETYKELLSAEARQPTAMRWVKRGALGLAAISMARWMLRGDAGKTSARTPPQEERSDD